MKKIIYAILLSVAFASVSCERIVDDEVVEYLEINANNISGKWQLCTWNDGSMAEGTYVYIDIVRNDRTYTIYQNIDSFMDVPHKVTGSYYLDIDPETGAVIRGVYDHDSGDWAHRYIITDLTATQMVWTAKDDPAFVQTWVRVDTIPVADDDVE